MKEGIQNDVLDLGTQWSDALQYNPRAILFVLARYNFVAKILGPKKSLLELGCSEGIGVATLSGQIESYHGVDMDADAIAEARRNWERGSVAFSVGDFLGMSYGKFSSVVSLDVIEHIPASVEAAYFNTIHENLDEQGVAIVGTPNIAAEAYQSEPSRIAHINLYSAERLKSEMQRVFQNVFMFLLNDEVVHTGFFPMGHYLMAVGCNRRPEVMQP